MASASLGEGDRGVIARLQADGDLKTLTGTDAAGNARVYPGWPSTLLARPASADFPRITAMRVADDPRLIGRGLVRIRLDLWSWDEPDEIDDMQVRCGELLNEQHWTHEGARLYAVSVASSDRSGRTPRSRLHTFDVYVS